MKGGKFKGNPDHTAHKSVAGNRIGLPAGVHFSGVPGARSRFLPKLWLRAHANV